MDRNAKMLHYKQKMEEKRRKRALSGRWRPKKLRMFAVAFLCVMALFLVNIHNLQTFAERPYAVRTQAQIMRRHAAGDRMIMPNRGRITDRNMQALAVSSTVFNVFVDVRNLVNERPLEVFSRDGQRRPLINELESTRRAFIDFFGLGQQYFDAMIATDSYGNLINNTHHFVIKRDVPQSRLEDWDAWLANERITTEGFRIRDIYFEEVPNRTYILGTLAAPIIGFYRGAWWGLEGKFNEYLTGTVGRSLTTFDELGFRTTDRTPPIHGAHLVLTLNLHIQRIAEDVAKRWAQEFSAANASVIVMNPHTGEVLAMAQYPSFDANAPADIDRIVGGALSERLSQLDQDSDEFFEYLFRLWTNFNVTQTYEPGSTYKPFVVAKALEEGLISRDQTFYCSGYHMVAGMRINCWRTWGHGLQTLTQALANSCNMAHIEIASILGRNLFWQYQRDFGFGIPSGIDLPAENHGIVFTPAQLNESELATSSFGQRFTATPIQTIASFAALINGGYIIRPHVVSQVIDNGQVVFSNNSQVQRKVISHETSDWLRRAMAYVVTDGTGRAAAIEGFAQGGKTGTAEQGVRDDPDFYWSISYIGYFPLDNPRYLIQVLVHQVPDEVYQARWAAGTATVTPMYREVAQEIIRLHSIPPTDYVHAPGTLHEPEFIENFVGLSAAEAISILNSRGRDYNLIGAAGNVILYQFPVAGSRATGSPTIVLSLFDDGTEILHEVPNVIGLSVPFAREILIQAGFVPRISYSGYFEEAGSGSATIARQITAGLRLPLGTEILLVAKY